MPVSYGLSYSTCSLPRSAWRWAPPAPPPSRPARRGRRRSLPRQDGDVVSVFGQQRRQLRELAVGRPQLGAAVGRRERAMGLQQRSVVVDLAQRDVAGDRQHRHAPPAQRRAHGDRQQPPDLRRLRHRFAKVTAVLEQDVGAGLLEIACAKLRAGNLGGDRQHRQAAAVAVVEAVYEVHVARPTAARAHRQLARHVRVRPRGERRHLLVTDANPFDRLRAAEGVGQRVQRIPDHAVDPPHLGGDQGVDDRLGHAGHAEWITTPGAAR